MSGILMDLWRSALLTSAMVATPFLLAALVVGVVTSLIQAATQLQDSMLAFIPKVIAVGLVFMLLGPWLLDTLTHYTHDAFVSLVEISQEKK